MKTINKVLFISTLAFSAFTAQAHITEDVTHTHEARSYFQTMSATDRLNFINVNQTNMELMSTEEREVFMVDMNNGANLNRSNQNGMRAQMQSMSTEDRQAFRGNMQSMSTEDRQAFRDSMGGGQSNMSGMGQGMGGGYGRGFGRR